MSAPGSEAPLILAAILDPATQEFLDGLRRRHFPPGRNQLAAHLTMFHALPAGERVGVEGDLRELLGSEPLELELTGVRSLGRGAAITCAAPALDELRATLARRRRDVLTRQDAQGFRAHVTVANFLDPAAARDLVAHLQAEFRPVRGHVLGVAVHRYRGGPWERLSEVRVDDR